MWICIELFSRWNNDTRTNFNNDFDNTYKQKLKLFYKVPVRLSIK
jgi:hypothetical protein